MGTGYGYVGKCIHCGAIGARWGSRCRPLPCKLCDGVAESRFGNTGLAIPSYGTVALCYGCAATIPDAVDKYPAEETNEDGG